MGSLKRLISSSAESQVSSVWHNLYTAVNYSTYIDRPLWLVYIGIFLEGNLALPKWFLFPFSIIKHHWLCERLWLCGSQQTGKL